MNYLLNLNKFETLNIQAFAWSNQLTINSILQGAWTILLGKYCATDDVVFGSTVSGRPPDLENVEFMVGLIH